MLLRDLAGNAFTACMYISLLLGVFALLPAFEGMVGSDICVEESPDEVSDGDLLSLAMPVR